MVRTSSLGLAKLVDLLLIFSGISYDHRVDIYATGIVFMQLTASMGTADFTEFLFKIGKLVLADHPGVSSLTPSEFFLVSIAILHKSNLLEKFVLEAVQFPGT